MLPAVDNPIQSCGAGSALHNEHVRGLPDAG